MPIEALPQNTIRAIGSTSVIPDAYSVVKELIDNALDASATSLQIEISQNTLDVIQLKDNGHGITPNDQKLVCKRAFTSKIQTLEDLKNVGGSSLGFRGEALASVAEMSGGISVTARVETEAVGLCSKYGRDGEVKGTERTSHPVGTTIRVTDFLKHIPVRRQTALKSAAKSLARIKKLLQSYALSQPSKRLSLKVLRAVNEKNNWSYAPSADPSLLDAALQLFGTEACSSCVPRSLDSKSSAGDENSSSEKEAYELAAFLPDAQFDAGKINNTGQYISVDGRPISNNRGIGQEIAKLFKSYIRFAGSKHESSKPTTDPFLVLHIVCPRGTYDVNIEPAKDDVLFEDAGLVLGLVEDLFRDHYGEMNTAGKSAAKPTKDQTSGSNQVSGDFNVLMARKPASEIPPASHSEGNGSGDNCVNPPLRMRLDKENMPTDSSSTMANGTPDRFHVNRGKRPGLANPWSISKINASFQTPQHEQTSLPSPRSGEPSSGSLRGSTQSQRDKGSLQHSPDSLDLSNPPTSRIASGSPVSRRRQQPHDPMNQSPTTDRLSGSVRRAERDRDRERYGNGALDTWFQRTTQVSLQQTPLEETIADQQPDELPLSSLAQERFGVAPDPSKDGAHDNRQVNIHSRPSSKERETEQFTRHSLSPDNSEDHVPGSMDSGRGFPVLERWAAQLHKDGPCEQPTDLEKALDFEKRKREAIQSRRLQLKNGGRLPKPQLSSDNSRYLSAKAALTSSQTSIAEPVSATTLSPNDSRAYLMRQQQNISADEQSKSDPKARRLLTSRLPLERIPDGSDLHNLGTTCSVELSPGFRSFKSDARTDFYIETGDEASAFSTPMENCLSLWNERITHIMKECYESKDHSQLRSPIIDISSIISQHLNDHKGKTG